MKTTGAEILVKPKFSEIEAAKIYADLRKKVIDAKILNRSYFYYLATGTFSLLTTFTALYSIIVATSLLTVIFWSLVFVFFSIQLAGLFHDAGHRAIFNRPLYNDIFGGFIAGVSNVSYSYWKFKHNKHHASPNEIDEDPDIEIPFISFTNQKELPNIFEKKLKAYQAWLYFPLGVFALIYFKWRSLVYFKEIPGKYLLWEIPFYVIGLFVWYVIPFLLMPLSFAIIFLILSNLGVGFYLMNIFAPNHKGMPQIEHGAKFSFLEQQIRTSRNVKSNWLLDIFYIGLNYQIEHHLFPNCPRNKLNQITPYVLEICNKYDLEFSEVSLVETNVIILKELSQIAATA